MTTSADSTASRTLETALADQALKEFEIQAGLRTPETVAVAETEKQLGPASERQATVEKS